MSTIRIFSKWMRYEIDTTYQLGLYTMSLTKVNSLGNEGCSRDTREDKE